MNTYGFIILRHINNNTTNLYWELCYTNIRKYYHYPIVIIDDNSHPLYKNNTKDDIILIHSEYSSRGEILPYYYLYKYKWFKYAIILHDSVFINSNLNFEINDYKPLWTFYTHRADNILSRKLLENLEDNSKLLECYDNKKWHGIFGSMCIISLEFLEKVENRHKFLDKFLEKIVNRKYRSALERSLSCLFLVNSINYNIRNNLCGDILKNYVKYGFSYNDYLENKYNINSFKLIKIWTGR